MTGIGTQIKNALSWFKTKCDSYYVRKTTDIINNCSSSDTSKPLSAAQGKELQSQIDSLKSSSGGGVGGGELYTNIVSYTVQVPADSFKHFEYPMSPSEYKILGVVGFDAATGDPSGYSSNPYNILVNQVAIYSGTYLKFTLYNPTSSSITLNFRITILCQKTS